MSLSRVLALATANAQFLRRYYDEPETNRGGGLEVVVSRWSFGSEGELKIWEIERREAEAEAESENYSRRS